MSALLAAGVGCSGAPLHAVRHWGVDAERRIHLCEPGEWTVRPELLRGHLPPIPGNAPPLTLDPHRLICLLADGDAWRLDTRHTTTWIAHAKENNMRKVADGRGFIAAGSACGCFWIVDRERRPWVWSPDGHTPIGVGAIPGDAPIAGVDVRRRTVLLGDGSRFAWLGGQWLKVGNVLDDLAATLRVVVVTGVCLGPPFGDVVPGQIIELPEGVARRLMESRHVEPAPPDTCAAH